MSLEVTKFSMFCEAIKHWKSFTIMHIIPQAPIFILFFILV